MPLPFVPAPDTTRDFRDALGCFGTGITIVTVQTPQAPLGMTVNSFASVSLDPPLVLWSLAKDSLRFSPYFDANHFAIHVLGREQRNLALHFAANGNGFDQFDWAPNAQGVPVLNDTLALFECRTEARHDAGDHTIIVGRVLRVTHKSGPPLLFTQSRYGGFEAEDG